MLGTLVTVDIIQDLGPSGSLFITWPAILNYGAKCEDFERAGKDFYKVIKDGVLKVNIVRVYALRDEVMAHEAIELGKTLGAIVLIL